MLILVQNCWCTVHAYTILAKNALSWIKLEKNKIHTGVSKWFTCQMSSEHVCSNVIYIFHWNTWQQEIFRVLIYMSRGDINKDLRNKWQNINHMQLKQLTKLMSNYFSILLKVFKPILSNQHSWRYLGQIHVCTTRNVKACAREYSAFPAYL